MSCEPRQTDKVHQVWTNPDSDADKPSLVWLTPDALSLAEVPKEDLDKTVAALRADGPVAAKVIPLATITQLQGDRDDNELTVSYKKGDSETGEVIVYLTDASKRDQLLDALIARLGPHWRRECRQTSRLLAGLVPLGATVIVCLVTWVFHNEAQRIAAGEHLEAHGRKPLHRIFSQLMHWIEGVIGPMGILIAGGLLAVVCFAWSCAAITRPPVRITIVPGKKT